MARSRTPSGSATSGTASSRSTSASVSTSCGSRFSMPGQFQLAGRVVQDDVLPRQPAEEVFEDAQPVALRAPAQAAGRWALVQRQSQR